MQAWSIHPGQLARPLQFLKKPGLRPLMRRVTDDGRPSGTVAAHQARRPPSPLAASLGTNPAKALTMAALPRSYDTRDPDA